MSDGMWKLNVMIIIKSDMNKASTFAYILVKPGKNSIFLKKGKKVISVENRKFSISRMTKWTVPLNSSREI